MRARFFLVACCVASLQVEKTNTRLVASQQNLSELRERSSVLEAELRRMQGRRDALTEENTSLGQKVRNSYCCGAPRRFMCHLFVR